MKRLLLLLAAFAFLGIALAAPLPNGGAARLPLFQAVAGPRWVDRAAQVWAESAFNAQAVSPVGARGPAQFMPKTWSWAQSMGWIPSGASPSDWLSAVRAQHAYMNYLEARCGGALDPALGAYNAGLGNVRKAQLLAGELGMGGHDAWLRALPRVTGTAHASETQGYIAHNAQHRAQLLTLGQGREPR